MVEEQVLTHSQKIAGGNYEIQVINDLDRFNALHSEWDELVERADAERLFLSHAWFRTWWEAFGSGKILHVVTVRSGGKLVAVAPMMRTRAGVHKLKVDSLESIYNPHTPRYDFIIAGGHHKAIYPILWNELANNSGCDLVLLAQVPCGSNTVTAIETLAEREGWLTGRWNPQPSPYIPLDCDYEHFLGQLKGSYRYNLRKRYERLAKLGAIDVEAITEVDKVREALEDGLRIEAAAWKGDQGTAILSDPAVTDFYVRLAERQAELGQLRLSFLRVGGKRISFNYLLKANRTLYGVKIGYDPEYHSYSPGNMHLNLILQKACAEGVREYDFLGVDDVWKLDWTREVRHHQWLFVFRNRLRPRLLHHLKFSVIPKVKPALKRIHAFLPGLF